MKKILQIFGFLILIQIQAFPQSIIQNLNGYKYVYVPSLRYNDGTFDKWGIRQTVIRNLEKSKFQIIEETGITEEIKNNPCYTVSCMIEHTANFYSSTPDYVTIKFINCNNETVYLTQGNTGSVVMSYKSGFQNATKRAMADFNSYYFKFDYTKSVQNKLLANLPKVEFTNETEKSIKEYLSKNKLDIIEGIYESYQSEVLPYYKIGIIRKDDKYKAIIIECEYNHWKPGEVKAIFEQSSMKGFYSAKWYMGNKKPYQSFANIENEAILSIELKDINTGEKTQDKFIKMYPLVDGDISFNKVQKSSGSGFFLTPNGIIATNAHVVENAETINIQISNEIGDFGYSAKVLLVDSGLSSKY
jgi:hypothetical protein